MVGAQVTVSLQGRVLAAGKTGPWCYVAMEYVDGESLTKVIQRSGVANMLDWKHAFRVAVHIAQGTSPQELLARLAELGNLAQVERILC